MFFSFYFIVSLIPNVLLVTNALSVSGGFFYHKKLILMWSNTSNYRTIVVVVFKTPSGLKLFLGQ